MKIMMIALQMVHKCAITTVSARGHSVENDKKRRFRNLKKFVKRPSAVFCHSLPVQVIKIPPKMQS